MENVTLTINSIIQALMLGCPGRDFVGKNVRVPSVFAISSLLKKTYLVTEILNFIEEICHQIHEN